MNKIKLIKVAQSKAFGLRKSWNKIFHVCIFMLLALIVFYTCFRVASILSKTEKFVDNYKTYNSFNKQIVKDTISDTIQKENIVGEIANFLTKEELKGWMVSIDPNNNYIHIRFDPDCFNLTLKKECY